MTLTWWQRSAEVVRTFRKEVFASHEEGIPFFRNRLVQLFVGISSVLILASVGLLFWGIGVTETAVVLHYNVFFGIDVFGSWFQVYALPLGTLFFLVVNIVLGRAFYMHRERMAAHILLLAAVLVAVGGFISSWTLVLVNR